MRTTVTLDPDVAALLAKRMRETGASFKKALNDALRASLSPQRSRAEFRLPARDLGTPTVDLVKALQLAASLEDEEIVRKLELRK
ncbi:antitoxin [Nocardia sp. AG03]|uniref:antitoxin n=1 Tax=Nocardia sp. AG03 TaxID=3025312 RepID=UPI0024187159|nr:antitoxin [Nocardia sp. AG03]